MFRICLTMLPGIATLFFLCSCGSSKVTTGFTYFTQGADTVAVAQKETLINYNDQLSIQVYSQTTSQEQATIFNTPAGVSGQPAVYQVSAEGYIEVPVIGRVKAAGLTKNQLQLSLIDKLGQYVKKPMVLIRFLQFNINVLGEVKTPGTQKFLIDKVSIIDALSAAGDLTDYGKRNDIKVIREEEGKRITYTVDLGSRNIFQSPVYLLQPNDIVYVSPNTNKMKNVSADPDAPKKTSLFFGILSSLVSVTAIVLLAFKK